MVALTTDPRIEALEKRTELLATHLTQEIEHRIEVCNKLAEMIDEVQRKHLADHLSVLNAFQDLLKIVENK
jgi:hypothetical protein